jgi:hypothetical protein
MLLPGSRSEILGVYPFFRVFYLTKPFHAFRPPPLTVSPAQAMVKAIARNAPKKATCAAQTRQSVTKSVGQSRASGYRSEQ